MKAIALTNTNQLEEINLPMPKANGGEVLVKIKYVALNPVDYKFLNGFIPTEFPAVLGHEFSGEVAEDHCKFKKGDIVYAYLPGPHSQSNGALAEYIALPEQYVSWVPKNQNTADAVAYPLAGMTALECFYKGFKNKGENVFIAGITGGVGWLLAQMLKHAGANIYCTVRSKAQQKTICNTFSLPENQCCIIDPEQDLLSQCISYFKMSQFPSCFDFIGGDFKLLCLKLTAFRGDMITIVEEANFSNNIFDSRESLAFQRSLGCHCVFLGAEAYFGNKQDQKSYQNDLATISDYLEKSIIHYPDIQNAGSLNISDIKNALAALKNRTTKANKLVIRVN